MARTGKTGALLLWTWLVCLQASNSAANDAKNTVSPNSTAASANVMRFNSGDIKAGKKLYKRYCRGCHGVDGRGGAHTFMPHIGNLTKRGYIDLLPDSYLYLIIEQGGEAVGKNSYMPAWKKTLSETQTKDVIAFVRSMPLY